MDLRCNDATFTGKLVLVNSDLLNNQNIGLVLSGGGVRGMAHIGVLKALMEFGIVPGSVSGSSVGALVGALYANGNTIEEMLLFFKETPLFKYNFFTISKSGFIDTDRYFDVFRAYFPGDTYEALKHKLYVVATNLEKGEEVFFSSGELIMTLPASAALPPVFSPVELDGQFYADGGIMNNFPLEPIKNTVDYVIGSNVSIVSTARKDDLKNSFQLTGRVTGLMIYAVNRQKLAACDLLFEAKEVETIGVLDRKGIEKAYTIGYDHARSILEKAN